ncbi:hypothetical protein [Vibrio coralliilyticus]|uniref:Uncharacterized protein n=1 Tax=Vibrio coralliilyticus TaxID=190893 RepID=A0AAP6ZNQ1_9VIBR|nr:hypothetical protein [Vibrio coralliilyticus]NOI31865.1 hypothetical protein [Vibrio coralliilyticus]NOJ25309.1 hypothetical protein [Vibrio coralliilyticus]
MLPTIQIESKSYRLKISGEHALNMLTLMSFGRYALLLTSFQMIYAGNYSLSLFLIALALLFHKSCYPYSGYRLCGYKQLSKGNDFVPLKHWMIANSRAELTGHEYEEVLCSFTEITKQKMFDVVQQQRELTVFDAVNLLMFDLQFARLEEYRLKDESLKAEIKKKL